MKYAKLVYHHAYNWKSIRNILEMEGQLDVDNATREDLELVAEQLKVLAKDAFYAALEVEACEESN